MIGPAIIDEELEFFLLLLLTGRLQPAPRRLLEGCLAVLGVELTIGVEPLGAKDTLGPGATLPWRVFGFKDRFFAARAFNGRALYHLSGLTGGRSGLRRSGTIDADRGFLKAVRAHGPQPRIGYELSAFLVLVIAVHESVFFCFPVEALEFVGIGVVAHTAQHALDVVGNAGRDQAIRHRMSGRIHIPLSEAHAALTIHGGEAHFAGSGGRKDYVTRCADFRRNDINVYGEKTALLDGGDNRCHHRVPVAIRYGVHRVFHDVGSLLVDALEFHRIQRRLVVIAAPNVMDRALALNEELVDIGSRPADMGVRRPRFTRAAIV